MAKTIIEWYVGKYGTHSEEIDQMGVCKFKGIIEDRVEAEFADGEVILFSVDELFEDYRVFELRINAQNYITTTAQEKANEALEKSLDKNIPQRKWFSL